MKKESGYTFMTESKNILIVDKLEKSYQKGKKALADFDYTFTNGIYGLLGPNGAGKSTLLNILTMNLKQSKGDVTWNNISIYENAEPYKKIIGYMPQSQLVYPGFTLEQFLLYMAALKGIEKVVAKRQVETLMQRVNLEKYARQKLGTFSGGMRQRALLAQALLGSPKLIILDEPTAGLDPKERIRMRELISEIAKDCIVIIATHVVQDVEHIAKQILFLKDGRLIASEPVKSVDFDLEELYMKFFEEDEAYES